MSISSGYLERASTLPKWAFCQMVACHGSHNAGMLDRYLHVSDWLQKLYPR